ncbi:MAG: electron transport complex subunit RsxC [Gammaproteobacteria bacterium]|nr:electron transport complex subunit RsxC [Gammaproteobacteria bacterium]
MPVEQLSHFHGGLKLPGFKALSTNSPIQKMALLAEYRLPLQQHIGEPAEAIVSVGERVLKGQMIAQAQGSISAPIHAPTSGTISAIDKQAVAHISRLPATCITLTSDGLDEASPAHPLGETYRQLGKQTLYEHLRQAGIVGLGGATFPTATKLALASRRPLKTLIINGAECEPYITCDQKLMEERADEVLKGIHVLIHSLRPRQCLIGVEDNKPAAINALNEALKNDPTPSSVSIKIVAIASLYPTGGEKQLIKVLTDQEVPSGGFPGDLGIVCQNIGSAYAIYRAIYEAEPLISRIVTLTGAGIQNPGNWEVLIGTPIKQLSQAGGGYTDDVQRLIMGGPMMGLALHSDELPISKASNCILALSSSELPKTETVSPCIRCGVCVEVCPANLLPQQLYWHSRAKDFDKAQDNNLFDCIECGCCDYVCPSHIPLVSFYRYAKTQIWNAERERQKADQARERHQFREQRIELAKQEKEAKMAKRRAALKAKKAGDSSSSAKQDAIKAALARVQAKKSNKASNSEGTQG